MTALDAMARGDRLSEQDMRVAVAYIRSLFQPDGTATAAAPSIDEREIADD